MSTTSHARSSNSPAPNSADATGVDLKLDGGLCDRVLGTEPGLPVKNSSAPSPVGPPA